MTLESKHLLIAATAVVLSAAGLARARTTVPAGRLAARTGKTKPPTKAAKRPAPAKIDWSKSGTYMSGKWKYAYEVTHNRKGKLLGRWGSLYYDGKGLTAASVNDYLKSPWGTLYWVGVPQMPNGLHGWMPWRSERGSRAGAPVPHPSLNLLNAKATERMRMLKKNVDDFAVVLRYHGPGKVAFSTLMLSVKPPQGQALAAQITKTQAAAVISHIRSDGFLGAAGNIGNKKIAYPKGPAYTMTVTGHGVLYEDLGWGAKMLQRLDALRRVFRNGSNAAMALDKFLRHFELRRVKWAGKDIKVLRLQRSGNWSYELLLARASSRSRRNVGLVTFNGVDFVAAREGDYLWTPWGKLIFWRGRYKLGWLPAHWTSPQPKGNEVESPDAATSRLVKTRYATMRAGVKKLTVDIRYHGKGGSASKENGDGPYRWLALVTPSASRPSRSFPDGQFANITESRAEKIIDHLALEGFLAEALDVADKAPKGPVYTLTVSIDQAKRRRRLYQVLGWDLKMLDRLDALRKVLGTDGGTAKAMDKLLAALEPQRKKWQARTQRDVKRRQVCMAALRKMRKDFAALAAKYPKELAHLGPGTIDEKKLLLCLPVKNLPKPTQPARRATPADRMRSVPRRLRPDEFGLFVQFTVPMPIVDFPSPRPMTQWLYSKVGFSWWWMWPNRSFSTKAQQDLMKMLNQALVPLDELENAMVAGELAKRGKGAYVLRGRPGVKLTLRLAPKNAAASPTIDLYATNETKKVVALCPPFPQIIGNGRRWHYHGDRRLSLLLIRAFGSGNDPFIYIKPGQTAKVSAVVAAGLSPGKHTVRVAARHARDSWLDMRPTYHDGRPITRKVKNAWTGVLVSGELAVDVPAPATQPGKTKPSTRAVQRAKELKANVEKFMISGQYFGPQDKEIAQLVFSVQPIAMIGNWRGPGPMPRLARISKAQGVKIINHLLRSGWLDLSTNVHGVRWSQGLAGPTYTLYVTGPEKVALRRNIGWGLGMLACLDALRKVLDGEAAKAMDKVLKALKPQRKKWQARTQRDVKRRRVCLAALREIRKGFAAIARKYPKGLAHLGPGDPRRENACFLEGSAR